MKIVRCLWGKPNHQFFEKDIRSYHDECFLTKQNDDKFDLKNQIVIVWDEVNRNLMEELGYPYHYMGDSLPFSRESNFLHKLLALDFAVDKFGEILFLDWDCFVQKKLDENFYYLLRSREDVQMPLYFYPGEILKEYELINPRCDEDIHYFNLFFYQVIRHGKWNFDDGLVIPNAGFIYIRNKTFPKKLLEIQKMYGVTTNIEEICSLIYFNEYIHTTEEYIQKIEPIVCLGKDDLEMRGKQVLLNKHTIKNLNKDIYFIHE